MQAEFQRNLLTLAVRYGLTSRAANPQVNNTDFVYRLVFDPARGANTPKARFAYLFPNDERGARPGAAEARARRRRARARDRARAAGGRDARVGARRTASRYTVTGAPVVVSDVSAELPRRCCGCWSAAWC